MEVYTYSEARQKLSTVLDKAESIGKVIIRRKDGRTFALTPERTPRSPLDVPSIQANVSTKELVEIVRKERIRTRGLRILAQGPGKDSTEKP
jgi:antitoxin Phd